ncbi:MAG: transporter [Marmoricola sp.]|nr:transporter [Marmoricola sp.]
MRIRRGGGPPRAVVSGPVVPASPGRTLLLLQVACFTSSFDRFMIAPMLLLIARDLDVSVGAVSQSAAAYFLAYGLMQMIWAAVSDRLGRVRTMRLALGLAALTGIMSALAPNLLVLMIARTLAGAAFSASVPSAMVYVGDTVPIATRQAALTDLMTGAALGMAVSTLAAASISELLSWRVAFAVTALTATLLAWQMRRIPEPGRPAPTRFHRSVGTVLSSWWAVLVLALAFAEGVVLLGFLTYFPITLQAGGSSTTLAGAVTTTYGVATMIFAAIVKRLTRTVSPAALTVVGAIAGVLAYGSLVADQGIAGVFAGCVLLGAARAFMHSTLQAWITDVVPRERATAVSMFSTLMFLGSSAAAGIGSVLVEGEQFQLLYTLALAIMVPLGAVAALSRARYARRTIT